MGCVNVHVFITLNLKQHKFRKAKIVIATLIIPISSQQLLKDFISFIFYSFMQLGRNGNE
jgi:hypothetical protein